MEESNMNRRTFLAGIGAAALGLGLTSVGCAPKAESASGDTRGTGTSWDEEVDFLVVGSGTAAMGALAAAESGNGTVMVIEKSDMMFGGTSSTSGGGFWIPMNYLQKEAGVQDSREAAVAYVNGCAGSRANEALTEAFVDNANPWLEWIHNLAQAEFTIGGAQDYYDQVDGFLSFGRNSKLATGNAGDLWSSVKSLLEEKGCEVRMGTALKRLVVDENGAIVGVIAEQKGKEIAIKASKVLVGTGGFDYDPQMMARHLPSVPPLSNAVQTNTGDGHKAAARIGARLEMMEGYWGVPFFHPGDPTTFDPSATGTSYNKESTDWNSYRGKPGSMVVNKQGARFGDEATMYPVFTREWLDFSSSSLAFENYPGFFICDSAYVESFGLPGTKDGGEPNEWFVKADTLEDLAALLGINPTGLVAEAAKMNAYAASGTDEDFHRGEKESSKQIWPKGIDRPELSNPMLGTISTPPFYGAVYLPGTCGTSGGMSINENAQVLNVDGEAIEGLYACGNCTAALSGGTYLGGGGTLGPGSVMAYIAARHAMGVAV